MKAAAGDRVLSDGARSILLTPLLPCWAPPPAPAHDRDTDQDLWQICTDCAATIMYNARTPPQTPIARQNAIDTTSQNRVNLGEVSVRVPPQSFLTVRALQFGRSRVLVVGRQRIHANPFHALATRGWTFIDKGDGNTERIQPHGSWLHPLEHHESSSYSSFVTFISEVESASLQRGHLIRTKSDYLLLIFPLKSSF